MDSQYPDPKANQRGMTLVPARAAKAPQKTYVSWDECRKQAWGLAQAIIKSAGNPKEDIPIWGVPRGGIYAALMVQAHDARLHIVDKAEDAYAIVDDIIDTGETERKFNHPHFFALFNLKKVQHDKKGWIIFPWETASMEQGPEDNIRRVLQFLGEDPTREGLLETPKRVVKSYRTIFGGYDKDPKDVFKVFEEEDSDQMVLLKNMEFYSTCEHHMIPFFGKAHIAYIPDGKVIGVSKLARLFEVFSRRLQIQERLCQQVTNELMENLAPLGAACMIEAQHMCMTARGVEKQSSVMVTFSLQGAFRDEQETRQEFYNLIKM